MEHQEKDFYQHLRSKIKIWIKTEEGKKYKWAEYIMFAPDLFHLLCKLSLDKDVPVKEKAKLVAAIAYFVSPIDLVPEMITGPVGYIDDIAIAAYVLNSIINNASPELVKKHWAGERDIMAVIQAILRVADKMVGKGLWKKLRGRF